MNRISVPLLVLVAVATVSCRQEAAPTPAPAPATGPTVPAATSGSAPATPPAAAPTLAVTRIVFLDKENCCACTQAATDASWAALQEALADHPGLPVERFHIDTQADLAAPYRSKRAMVAVPGIYFLDAGGGLVEMLQGEVTAGQIRGAIR